MTVNPLSLVQGDKDTTNAPVSHVEALQEPLGTTPIPSYTKDTKSPSEALQEPLGAIPSPSPSPSPSVSLYDAAGRLRPYPDIVADEVKRMEANGEAVPEANPFFTGDGDVIQSFEDANPWMSSEAGREYLVAEELITEDLSGSDMGFWDRQGLATKQMHMYFSAKLALSRLTYLGEDSTPITPEAVEKRLNHYPFIDYDQMAYMLDGSDSLEELDHRISQFEGDMEQMQQLMGDSTWDIVTGVGHSLLASSYDLTLIALAAATGGLGYLARGTAAAAKVNRLIRANRLAKALPAIAKGRYAKITAIAAGASIAEGYMDRKLRGQVSSTQDFALDMLMGLGVGTLWTGVIAGSSALKGLFNRKSLEASRSALASDLRDKGIQYSAIEDKALRKELEPLQVKGEWKSTAEMDQFYAGKGVDKEISRLERFNLFSQLARDPRGAVSNLGKFLIHGSLQGAKRGGVKEKQAISLIEVYQRRLSAAEAELNDHKLRYLKDWNEELGHKGPMDRMGGNFIRANFQGREKNREFHDLVTLALNGTKSEFKAVNDMADYILKRNKQMADRLVASGVVKKEELLDGDYFPMKWDMVKVKEKFREDGGMGKERFISLLMSRIEPMGDGGPLSIEDKALIASIFADALDGRSRNLDITGESIIGAFVRDHDSPEYQAFIAEFNKRKGKGNKYKEKKQGNLKFRLRLKDSGGLLDYMDTNFESVQMRYNMQMEAVINMREQGITPHQLDQMRDYALDELDMNNYTDSQKAAAINYITNIAKGRPAYDDIGAIGQGIRFMKDLAYLRVANNMGLAQIPDLFVRASEQGMLSLFKQFPLFGRYLKALEGAEAVPPKLLKDMQVELGGLGMSRVMGAGHYDAEFGDGFSGIRYVMENLRQGVNMANLMNLMVDFTQKGALEQLLLDWRKVALGKQNTKGGKVLGNWTSNRLAEAGLDPADVERLGRQISKHGTEDSFNLPTWDNPADAELFRNSTFRLMNKAAQRLSVGERVPMLAGNGSGDILVSAFMHFKQFLFGATYTQFLRNAQHRDTMAAFALMYGFLGGIISYQAYIMQKKVTLSDRQYRKWEKEYEPYSPAGLVKGAVGRASIFGLIPTVIDMATPALGMDPLFSYRYSGYTNVLSVDNLPFLDITGKVARIGKAAQDRAWKDEPLTHEDALDIFKTLNNHMGFVIGADSFLKLFDLPHKY